MSRLLSICVPTHDGRAAVLGELIDSLERELRERPPACDVELCVSDNASQDGTRELVAAAAERLSCPVAYRRNERNLGLVPNLLAVVEQARGEHCWLLGSDDLLAHGGLRTVAAAIERLPGAGGYVFPSVDVSAADVELRTVQPPRALLPAADAEQLYHGADAIYAAVGNAWIGISWNVVAREPWVRHARASRARLLANPTWPQVLQFAAVAAERGSWAWCPSELAALRRSADPFLFERGGTPLADRWAELVDGLSAAWAEVLGGRNAAWRRQMRVIHGAWGGAVDARATKLYDRPPIAAQWRLARSWLRAFGRAGIGGELLAALTLPSWAVRALYDPGRGRVGRRAELVAGRDSVELFGALPQSLSAGGVEWVEVELRNRSRHALHGAGPRSTGVEQRWRTVDGVALDDATRGVDALGALPTPLNATVRRGAALSVAVPLLPPRAPGDYVLELAPHQTGVGGLDAFGLAQPLVASVTVGARR